MAAFRSDASSWLLFVRTRLRGCLSFGRVFVAARSDAPSSSIQPSRRAYSAVSFGRIFVVAKIRSVVIRTSRRAYLGFGESTDAFPQPRGYSYNPGNQGHPSPSSEIGIGSDDPFKAPQ